MPKIGDKEYPYTVAGRAAYRKAVAERAANSKKKKVGKKPAAAAKKPTSPKKKVITSAGQKLQEAMRASRKGKKKK